MKERPSILHTASQHIRRKITQRGAPNPRYITALREEALSQAFLEDMKGHYKILSKAQIRREYTPERVAKLLADGNRNLKLLQGPRLGKSLGD